MAAPQLETCFPFSTTVRAAACCCTLDFALTLKITPTPTFALTPSLGLNLDLTLTLAIGRNLAPLLDVPINKQRLVGEWLEVGGSGDMGRWWRLRS